MNGPIVLRVSSDRILASAEVLTLIDDTRRVADAFVFLSGGASKMSDKAQRRLLDLLGALALLTDRRRRIAVGDGGTQSGIMEAAGLARRASRRPFPLIGVAPAPELTIAGSEGHTLVDPNHTYVIAVDNPAWVAAMRARGRRPDEGYWGSETTAMYAFFNRLAQDRPSVTIVANGGAIVLDEVRQNVTARRVMVLVAGSGRVADALVASLTGAPPADDEATGLLEQIDALGLTTQRDLYRVFDLNAGPDALAFVLGRLLESR
jgi:hypothetical protein